MSNWPIKYTAGSQPSKTKRKSIERESAEKDKEKRIKTESYEKDKRHRSFNRQWLKEKPWLVYDEENSVMKCSWCIQESELNQCNKKKTDGLKGPKSQFVTGSANFKYGTINDHEKSSQHKEAVAKKRASEKPSQTPAAQGLLALNEHIRKQLEFKFRNIHAVVKHNRPLTDFVWLNELDKAKGLDVGISYNNEKAGPKFLKNIADMEREHSEDVVADTKFFSLTMDGTTDGGTVEQETLFMRTCRSGNIDTRFICIGEPEATTSEALHAFVLKKLDTHNISPHMQKCVGFGSDGAATMVGKRNGLIALLKRDHPSIVGVHCLAHRLELCFRDVFAKNKTYEKLVTLLLGIYYFYKKSSKQRKGLKDTFKVYAYKLNCLLSSMNSN